MHSGHVLLREVDHEDTIKKHDVAAASRFLDAIGEAATGINSESNFGRVGITGLIQLHF